MSEHRIEQNMARTWDQQGHQSPRDWWWECSCGARSEGYLRRQDDSIESWKMHRDEAS